MEDISEAGLQEKVSKQIHYYFSDNNLVRDKFMKEKIKEDEGWITLECLLTFKRLKKLCDDKERIMGFLEAKKDTLIELSREKMSVRRSPNFPLPEISAEDYLNNLKPQTILLKGFPIIETIDIDMIENFIEANQIKNVMAVRMMKNRKKSFVGNVYVQFISEDDAKEFMKSEAQLKFIHEDKESTIIVYSEENRKSYKKKKAEKSRERFYDQIGYSETQETKGKLGFQPGQVIKFSVVGCGDGLTRELIKESLNGLATIKWVTFQMGELEGFVQFLNGGDAYILHEKLKKEDAEKTTIKVKKGGEGENEIELEINVLEGQDEINYWRSKIEHKGKGNRNMPKKRMRNDPKNVKPQGKITKFDDGEDGDDVEQDEGQGGKDPTLNEPPPTELEKEQE